MFASAQRYRRGIAFKASMTSHFDVSESPMRQSNGDMRAAALPYRQIACAARRTVLSVASADAFAHSAYRLVTAKW
jgi:hypothetical protein